VGPSDEQLVNTTMAEWKAAMAVQDIDKLMAAYSENYVSSRGGGKDSVREFMTNVFELGYLDNVKVNLEDAQITIEADKAKVGHVELTFDAGAYVLEYTLQKENEAWLIVSSKRLEQ
jgi:ketosteroid isomerase-like protein